MTTTHDAHEAHDDLRDGPDGEPLDGSLDGPLDGPLDEVEATTTSLTLFEGDEGGLPLAQRRALLALVKLRFITARTHPREWAALVEAPRALTTRLNDLFLELVVDRERGVAYKRQAVPEAGGRFPTLLHDTAWNREETITLVFLRNRFFTETAKGEAHAWVDHAELVDHLMGMRPVTATDAAGDEQRARNAISSVYKTGLLMGSATGERFEISPAVEVLLPVERLTELLSWLRDPRSATEPDTEPDTEPEADTAPDTDEEAS